jgi:chitin disaccharide deacetylase
MRLLIVNADDYGLTKGVSRAILHAHQEGIVTSTSALAVAPGFKPTVAWLRDTEGIGIGAHLAAVGEDPPLLSALEVPTLVDGQGRLASSWKSFLPRMAARQIDPDDLRLEFAAQIQRLQGAGLPLTHVDTHQHLHLWPGVADVVLDLAAEHGIPAVRVTRSSSLSPVGLLVRRLSARLARRADQRGLRSTDTATGLDQAGRFDGDRMRRAIARLGAGSAATAELGTHPGQPGDADLDRYAWGYRWADELKALTAPATAAAVADAGFTLGTYADLPAPRTLPGSAVHLATSHLAGPARARRHDT